MASISTDSLTGEIVEKNPDLELAQIKFKLSLPEFGDNNDLKAKLIDEITKASMAPWYERVCSDLKWNLDEKLLLEMKTTNEQKLNEIDEEISEAEKFLTDVEVRDGFLKKAKYLSLICDEKKALESLQIAFDKTIPTTHRIEILLHCIRIGLFFMNHQGICPGNRLRLIPGFYTDLCQSRESSPCGPPPMTELNSDLNTLQRQGKRRSWHVQPNKVLTPKKYNDVYLYDMPPSRCSPVIPENHSPRDNGDSYDVPPRAVPVNYDTPRNWSRCSPAPSSISPIRRDSSESYDVPRPLTHNQQLTPSSSLSSLTADSLSSSNRSSVINMPDYDVPKPRGPQLHLHPHPHLNPNNHQVYDVPASNPQLKELPLELSSALDSLARLQTDATAAISRLLGYVTPQWRRKEKLESKIMDIKLAVVRLKTSLHDLAEFGEGALGNAARAPDKGLAIKLRPLVIALRNADKLIQEAAYNLDQQNWSIDVLALPDDNDSNSSIQRTDSLEQLVACSRALTEDVRQITSFIQGNSTLLFKRASSPQANNNNGEWIEDYDYVNLESREAAAKKHAEIRDVLPTKLREGYDTLIKNAESAAINNDATKATEQLDPDDKQVLTFYAAQAVTHHKHLTQAIDAFLQTVEHNQPPKVFLAHDKFVVLSAHKLVHIGDTVHRNVQQADIRTRVLNCANSLSDSLATSVAKTKQAALQFPSVTAVQEMVDSVVDISHLARDLKLSLVQAAQP